MKRMAFFTSLALLLAGDISVALAKDLDIRLSPKVARTIAGLPPVGTVFTADIEGTGPVNLGLRSLDYTGCATLPQFNQYAGIAWDLGVPGGQGGNGNMEAAARGAAIREALFGGGGVSSLDNLGATPTLQSVLAGDKNLVREMTRGQPVRVKVLGYTPMPNAKVFLEQSNNHLNFRMNGEVCLAVEVKTATGEDLALKMAEAGAGVQCQGQPDDFATAYAKGAQRRMNRIEAWDRAMVPVAERLGVKGLIGQINRIEGIGQQQLRSGMPANLSKTAQFGGLMLTPQQKATMALGSWTQQDTLSSVRYMRNAGFNKPEGCLAPIQEQGGLFLPKEMLE